MAFPTGELVDIGGVSLAAYTMGEPARRPPVIFEAGLGGVGMTWLRIQPIVAEQTFTVSYDRAGTGRSAPSPRSRTPWAMAQELKQLLRQLEVAPPYMLVGHSVGGLLVRYFAGQQPSEVAGLVLVDASHEMQMARAGMSDRSVRAMHWLYGAGSALARARLGRWIVTRFLTAVRDDLTEAEWRQLIALTATPSHFSAMWAEARQFGALFGADHVIPATFGSLPLHVVTAEMSMGPTSNLNERHRRNQAELAAMSTKGTLRSVREATHLSILSNHQHARVVADVILEAVRLL